MQDSDIPRLPNGDWIRYSELVLRELKRLADGQDKLVRENADLRVEIATLKVKASIWGGVAGAIPVLILIGLTLLERL